jgi:hypothetical protein
MSQLLMNHFNFKNMTNIPRDINKERDALKQVTQDKQFLNKIGIRAGANLTTLKTSSPNIYRSLFDEVNRRAYKTPSIPDVDVPPAPTPALDAKATTQPKSTLDQAVEKSDLLRKAAERIVTETAPQVTPSQQLKANIPGIQEEAGLTSARKKFAKLQAEFVTAPRDIRDKLIEEKDFDIDKISEQVDTLRNSLATARGRFLEGSLSSTDFAKLASNFYHNSRVQKQMLRDLTDETAKGVEHFQSLIKMSQIELGTAEEDYNTALQLESQGILEAKEYKDGVLKELKDSMDEIEQDKTDYLTALGYVKNPETGKLEKTFAREQAEKPKEPRELTVAELLSLQEKGLVLEDGSLVTDLNQEITADANQIADAMKKIESGGDYNREGGSGEFGAYQFMPDTWEGWSQEYLASIGEAPQSLQMTPENQDAVAQFKIQQLLDQGHTPQQVASIWNSGSPVWEGNASTGMGGTLSPNKFGQEFSTPNHVRKFINALGVTGEAVSDEKQIALDIFSGASTLDTKSLPTAQRVEVDKELSLLRKQAKDEGNFVGIMRSSAGGKDVSEGFRVSFEKAVNVVAQIGDLQNTFDSNEKLTPLVDRAKNPQDDNETSFDLNPIVGKIRKWNPWDQDAQTIKAQLQAIIPNLARGIYGEVGVLTDNDIKNYSQTLPTLTSTEDVRKAVLGFTIKSIQRAIENKLTIQARTGKDVSGLTELYTDISDVADDLLTQAGFNVIDQTKPETETETNIEDLRNKYDY